MSSFFVSSDKVKVGQTSVSIPSENGLNYRPGGKIDIFIPPTSKFVDLSQSKLKFNVSMAFPTQTATSGAQRLQLDAETGLHSLIRSVRIFTGRKTALLEEIEGYDVLTALRFDYETNQNLQNKRVLTDGATGYDPACRGNQGTTKTLAGNVHSNPWFDKVLSNTSQTASFATADPALSASSSGDFKVVTGELELNTGLFRNNAVFPTVLTDGLFIEILLQDSQKVFRQLDSTTRDRRLHLNPLFHSLNGSDTTGGTSGSWANGAAMTSFYIDGEVNNMTSLPVCPLVVGQNIAFVNATNGSLTGSGTISQLEFYTGAAYGRSKIKVTCSAITNNTGINISVAIPYLVVNQTSEQGTSYNPTYTVSDVEMVVEHIQVPDGYEQSMLGMMKEGGTINYDYRSFTNYRYSQTAGDLVANIRLPLIESRATAILCVPTDATVYSSAQALSCSNTYLVNEESGDYINRSSRSGLVGIADEIQDYQLIYDGRINPSRRVDCSKISSRVSISQQWLIEAEKALAMADIEPLSFLGFQDNFFLGRALALGRNSVYDARGKDFNLQVNYTGSTAPVKNKLWMNFCSHIRRMEIKNGGITVMV